MNVSGISRIRNPFIWNAFYPFPRMWVTFKSIQRFAFQIFSIEMRETKKKKTSFHWIHWFWALSTIPICHTCRHYGRCQSVKHFSMVVDIVDTIWKRSQTGAFCFLYASIPSKDAFDAILLYYRLFLFVFDGCEVHDGLCMFMHQNIQNSNSKSRYVPLLFVQEFIDWQSTAVCVPKIRVSSARRTSAYLLPLMGSSCFGVLSLDLRSWKRATIRPICGIFRMHLSSVFYTKFPFISR